MSSSTVAEIVHNEIRKNILYGELQPGVKLKLEALCERYSFGVNTRTFANRFFFELVERRAYRGFGAANAPVRLASQTRMNRRTEAAK